jgi:hypothetical protein
MARRTNRPARSGASTTPTQQVETQAGDGEHFDLNVSGSDSDEELIQRQPHGHRTASSIVPTELVDQQVNNPAVREKKTAALDIKYFFGSHGDENVACKECK